MYILHLCSIANTYNMIKEHTSAITSTHPAGRGADSRRREKFLNYRFFKDFLPGAKLGASAIRNIYWLTTTTRRNNTALLLFTSLLLLLRPGTWNYKMLQFWPDIGRVTERNQFKHIFVLFF